MDTITAKLIAFRVKKGNNEAQSTALLEELLEAHTGYNLASALNYNNFATIAGAERAAEMLAA